MIPIYLKDKIEDWAAKKIIAAQSVSGGSIAQISCLQFEDGSTCFFKTGAQYADMFLKEASGLREIKKANCIRVPEVLYVDSEILLLEYIQAGVKDYHFDIRLGEQLAELHSKTNLTYGFRENNYIGANPQINSANSVEKQSWVDFYYNKRLLYQFKLAEKNTMLGDELKNGFLLLENRIEEILEGSEEKPSLLHGDLWGGNYMCDEQSNPVLIDPAVHYGHREAEMAMTKLFGGFGEMFYQFYQRKKPLPEGYDYRENIYMLYHVLNHLNLFGSSYYAQAVRLVWSYLH